MAQTLFNPMYQEIDLTEAKTDARFDSKLIQTLETEGISDYRILEKSDGTAELHFQVNSLEQYGRIREQSGYAVRLIEVADYTNSNVQTGSGSNGKGQNTKEIWEPSSYRAIVAETQLDTDVDPLEMQKLVDAEKDKFIRALAGSLHAPGFTVENMDRALGYTNSYAVGDQTTLELDADFIRLSTLWLQIGNRGVGFGCYEGSNADMDCQARDSAASAPAHKRGDEVGHRQQLQAG